MCIRDRFLFEADAKSRRRMVPFLVVGGLTALYILWALTAYPCLLYTSSRGEQRRRGQSAAGEERLRNRQG